MKRVIRILAEIFILYLIVQSYLSISQHSRYVADVYDCSNMSCDFHEFLKVLGIKSYFGYGIYNKTTGHVWVIIDLRFAKIPFETTIFFPVNPVPHLHLKNVEVIENEKEALCFYFD